MKATNKKIEKIEKEKTNLKDIEDLILKESHT